MHSCDPPRGIFFTEMATSESQLMSPAPSIVSTSHGALLGRPLKSAVLKFFEYNAQIEKSVCQVIKANSSTDAASDQCVVTVLLGSIRVT